tara:strand:- start:19 stop:198 length:180 start_codon:yes stop_codon:yes gene_type:complete
MEIKNAKYFKDISDKTTNVSINAEVDGVNTSIPLDPDNRHYAEIQKQVKEGTLTIKDAD